MPLTRAFKDTIRERAERDPKYRLAMLEGALTSLNAGEPSEAKILLRDYINAMIGFQALSDAIDRDPKSLMRSFSIKGNPTLDLLSQVLKELAKREGYEVKVELKRQRAAPVTKPRARRVKVAAAA